MSLFHESLQQLLSGATLSGFLVEANGQPAFNEVAVLVEGVAKAEALHQWRLEVVVTPGGNGETFSVTCDVHWAGSIPVLTIGDAEVPGFGTINARLMLDHWRFAGTWAHDDRQGHVGGAIVSQEGGHGKRFVIERTSEYLREWWTGSGWSKSDRDAEWFEHEPDAPRETDDEEARAVYYPRGRVGAG